MNGLNKEKNNEAILLRYFKLVLGLYLYAIAIVITINADLGYFPWDVFHQGLSNIFKIKIGTANVFVGLIILGVGIYKGQRPGIGTILNMILIGSFTNLIMYLDFLPSFSNLYIRLLTLIIALFILSYGSYLYIAAGFGAGPRDGFMLLIHQKTGKSISFVRNSIEISVLVAGYLLGGPVGIGTLILSFGTGYVLQFVFDLLDFDTNTVEHRDWDDEIESLKGQLRVNS